MALHSLNDSDDGLLTPKKSSKSLGKQRAIEDDDIPDGHGLIVETSFDAYFKQASARVQTSDNIFSELVEPISAEEYHAHLPRPQQNLPTVLDDASSKEEMFLRFKRELDVGFNILFYGFGSKRRLMNDFARKHCARSGHVVVANAYKPDFTLRSLLKTIVERVPELASLPTSNTAEAQSKRIYSHPFSHHLYLVIHNIDSPTLRTPKAKSCLALLALSPFIHLVASIDHINAPLLFPSTESFARKHSSSNSIEQNEASRGFSWLWHDLTTLEGYDVELRYADRSSIDGVHKYKNSDILNNVVGGGNNVLSGAQITETAAMHILASVTQRAKNLFTLMAKRQLESSSEDETNGTGGTDMQQHAISYDTLFNLARDEFLAVNDAALRSLLGEFRDHGLVVSKQGDALGGGGEVLWIPMRRERLRKVLNSEEITGLDM